MAKAKDKSPIVKTAAEMARQRRLVLALFALAIVAGGTVGAFIRVRQYVDKQVVFSKEPPRIVLKDRPAWMKPQVAAAIARSAQPMAGCSAFDRQVLEDIADIARRNPWVKKVKQVRRVFDQRPGDTIEIDCEYRIPAAWVRDGGKTPRETDRIILVDTDGIILPENRPLRGDELRAALYGPDGKVNLRCIDGVARRAPMENGRIAVGLKWIGDDLQEGLKLARILHGRAAAEQLIIIDVNNHAGRQDNREAYIVCHTPRGSVIRWGGATDTVAEITGAQKLLMLDQLVQKFKSADMNQPWVDLRFDQVGFPKSSVADAH